MEFLAATSFGQYFIKKIDSLLQTLERPAKYCVDGDDKDENLDPPWPVFWTVFINLQIFRVVFSTVCVLFKKNPIEPMDIVKNLRKWRRTLRSIRFRGLQRIWENENGNGVTSSPTLNRPIKKSDLNVMPDDNNLLEELMNRTFSDNDDLDSTFTISRDEGASINCSSDEESSSDEDYHEPAKSKNVADLSVDVPIASESNRHKRNVSSESDDTSFESTAGDTDESAFIMTREDHTSSLNEESRTKFENNGKLSIGSTTESNQRDGNGYFKIEADDNEELDEVNVPVEAVINKLVQMQKDKTTNFRISHKYQTANKKKGNTEVKLAGVTKRKTIGRPSLELVLRQPNVKDTKGQESNEKE